MEHHRPETSENADGTPRVAEVGADHPEASTVTEAAAQGAPTPSPAPAPTLSTPSTSATPNEPGTELSRTEILERARNENAKNGDERQRGQMQWANYAGFIAMEFACIIIMFSKIFTGDEFTPEFFCILFTGIAAQNIVQACVNKNKKTKTVFIVCAVLITACTGLYWVFWILGLCGINI